MRTSPDILSAPDTAAQVSRLPSTLTSIVFDLDGTLVDSSPGIATSLAIAFRAVGRVMPQVDIRKVIGPPIRIIARRVEPSLSDAELDNIEPVYRADYDTEGWRNTLIFDGVADSLSLLRSHGLRLFIVTNKPRIPTNLVLDQFGLRSFFHETLTRDGRSPAFTSKAEMLATLIEQHQLEPHSTLMVGDTIEDQETARANHVPFLFVTYGFGSIESASLSIDRFTDLTTCLKTCLEPQKDKHQ